MNARSAATRVVVPITGEATPVEATPLEALEALAEREGLRGRHAHARALALFVLRAADRRGRAASIRRARALLAEAAAIVDAIAKGEP